MKTGERSYLSPGVPVVEIAHVRSDSRQVQPGDLFAVVQGTQEDGARYISSAVARGAVALLMDESCRGTPQLVPVLYARDVRRAMAYLAAETEGDPSATMPVLAVTGTNGKTTTAWLTAAMLTAAGHRVGLQTTVEVVFGDRTIPSDHTTPGACELQERLAQMRDSGCTAAVTEASSHALDQERLAAVRLAGAGFTNLTEDHLDYHRTMAAYFEAKKKLFIQLAELNPGAAATVFVDAAGGPEMRDFVKTLPLRVQAVGLGEGRGELFLCAEKVRIAAEGTDFDLVAASGERAFVHFALSGLYNVANALTAAGLAMGAGVSFEAVVSALRQAKPRWGRLERVETDLPFTTFVDYAHTDDALRNVLTTVRAFRPHRLSVVFGCGGDRDRAKRPLMGKACAECADRLYVTSDNPRSENPSAIIDEILVGIPEGTDFRVEPDRRAAIRLAMREAEPGDVIVVAGKGHETTQTIAGVAHPFDDRQEVAAAAAAWLSTESACSRRS